MRLIRVMCAGRVDLAFVLRAFANGVDGVFIGGCRLNECNYITHGNFHALNMALLCRRIMEHIGLNPERLRIEFMSAAEMWVEVTVPYVDLVLANPPGRSPWLEYTTTPRLYYSQIMWVDQVKTDEGGQIWYRLSDRYGSFGDFFWAVSEAFRPLQADEMSPIHPEVEDKLVVVDLTYQGLSCMEGNDEVYFCRVSTGAKFDMFGNIVDAWATPIGEHIVTRKYISLQMSGGTTGAGYDLPGIGWSIIFATGGVAIHSTFWHNNFGDTMSHGCVNVTPEDARWIFRWTHPNVAYDPGMVDITVTGEASTRVEVYAV